MTLVTNSVKGGNALKKLFNFKIFFIRSLPQLFPLSLFFLIFLPFLERMVRLPVVLKIGFKY